MDTIRSKVKAYKGWKLGQVTCEEDKCIGTPGMRKHFFVSMLVTKGKKRGNMVPLQKETRDLVTDNTERAEVLKAFFASVFNHRGSNHTIRTE